MTPQNGISNFKADYKAANVKMETAQAMNVTNSKGVAPMLGLDLHGWEQVMLLSLIAAGIAAVIVAFSTSMVVKLQRLEVKATEEVFSKYKEDAGKEIAAADVKAAEANRKAAEANERAANAELKTEQLKKELGPRQLKRDMAMAALLGQPKLPVEIMYLRDDPECFRLAQEIENVLREAKWEIISRSPIPSTNFDGPNSMGVSGQPSGVTVAAHEITQAEADADLNRMMHKEWAKTPWTVLVHALGAGLGKISSWAGGPDAPPPDRLRVVVSSR